MRRTTALLGLFFSALVGAQEPALVGAQEPALVGAQEPALLGAQEPALVGAQEPALVGAQEPAPSAEQPWLEGPFTAAPTILLRAAEAADAGEAAAITLYHDTSYTFDKAGRATFRRHWVYRIVRQEGLADWSVTRVRWAPWYQSRPKIKARVITPDGAEHYLSADSVTSTAAPEGNGGEAGDRQFLQAILPAVSVGAVIEEEVVLRDVQPLFASGMTYRHFCATLIPVQHGRLQIDVPTHLALRYGVRLLPGLRPTQNVANGRARLEFEYRNLPAAIGAPAGMPSHRPRHPSIVFSTGRSWQKIATGLSAIVDRAIAGANLDSFAEVLRQQPIGDSVAARGRMAPDPMITNLLAAVRHRVKYDGLELQASRTVPERPEVTLRRGTGDGLDLSVLTVALLRHAGYPAHVALLDAGFGVDTEPQLPGLGLMSHAVVHVATEPPIWLDPSSAFSRPGQLPVAAQGRFALIAAPSTEKLISTPAASPEDNLAAERRQITFADFGPGKIVETSVYRGSADQNQRRVTSGLDDRARRRGYQAYARAFHRASGLGTLQESQPDDLGSDFELTLEALDSQRVVTDLDSATVEVPVADLAKRLPPIFRRDLTAPRQEEFVFQEPFVTQWSYIIELPPGFRPLNLPPNIELALGPGEFRQSIEQRDGSLVADLRFDVGQRLLTAHQFETMHAAVREFQRRPPLVFAFAMSVNQSVNQIDGRPQGTLGELHAAVRQNPGLASHRVRLTNALVEVGLTAEALRHARQAVSLAPRWGLSHWALGEALQYDGLGRRFTTAEDLAPARRALEEGHRLAPEDRRIRQALARLAERGEDGVRYGIGADLDRALEAYGDWPPTQTNGEPDLEWLSLLLRLGRWQQMLDVSAIATAQSPTLRQRQRILELAARTLLSHTNDSDLRDSKITQGALIELLDARHYAAAAALLRRTAGRRRTVGAASVGATADDGTTLSSLADVIERTQPHEMMELHPHDPRTPVQGLLVTLLRPRLDRNELARWLHSQWLDASATELAAYRQLFERLLPGSLKTLAGAEKLSAEVLIDLALAAFTPTINGAPHLGYRLTLAEGDRIFLNSRANELKVAAFGDQPATLGSEAWSLIQQGEVPGAYRWLNWALEEPAAADSPVKRWWRAPKKDSDLDPAELRTAIAMLYSAADEQGETIPVLRQALASNDGGEALAERRDAIEEALLAALRAAGNLEATEQLSADLLARRPQSAAGFGQRLWTFEAREDWAAAEQLVDLRLQQIPQDAVARQAKARLVARRGDQQQAEERFRRLEQAGLMGAEEYRLWLALQLYGPEPKANLQLARRAQAAGFEDSELAFLIAVSLAEGGQAIAAHSALLEAVGSRPEGLDQPTDWYVFGRIAESCGLLDIARDLYSRVLSQRTRHNEPPSPFQEMAQRRLAALLEARP